MEEHKGDESVEDGEFQIINEVGDNITEQMAFLEYNLRQIKGKSIARRGVKILKKMHIKGYLDKFG